MEIKKYGLYKSKIEDDIVKEGEFIREAKNIVQVLSGLHEQKFCLIRPKLENDGEWYYLVWKAKDIMYCWAISKMK